ncbi:transcriptional regulator [Yinghuangia seranimata]|uniref:transcriptional regulator n=1 Tax=Yinghuangia seranimata TaxID=408067 RepID=UPI00248ABFEE|nr:transcriptional regulator [Yinghuangia seranimata]MDI2127955.1 transcriptional regulator [Yinghuangia seranimata]
MSPNSLLGALLDEAGVSRAGLAKRVNDLAAATGRTTRYDHTSVGRWIRGQRPRPWVIELVRTAVGERLQRPVSVEDIGMAAPGSVDPTTVPLPTFVERVPALWRADQRRPDERDDAPATGMDAIAPVWQWENPPDDRDVSHRGSTRVDRDDLEVLRAARTHYEAMYRQAGGLAAHPRVLGFLTDYAAPAIRGSYSDTTGRELLRAVGGLVAVAGICAYDSDRQGTAQRYFHQALRMAKASGDRGFGGYVIALLVNQALYLREYRQATAFAQAGIRTAGPHLSAALAADLYVMQAKAYARMRDQAGAHQAMRQAEQEASSIRRSEEPPETAYVQPGLVEAQCAETLLSLNDPAAAQAYAEEAVRVDAHARGRVHRLGTLTSVAVACGDVDRAATTASAMLDALQGMESRRLHDHLRGVHRRLARHADARPVRDVVDRVETVLAMPV